MKKLPHSNNFYKKKQFLSTKVFLTLLLLLGTNFAYSQSPSTFTASGTWICPKGVNTIQVEAIGGGAGLHRAGASSNGTGGSGGANGTRPAGGLYGGGGGACDDDTTGSGGAGGRGAVRLVWGFNYSFPNGAPSGIVGAVAQLGINYLPQIDQF